MTKQDDKRISAERPLECAECKKPSTICYTEIIGKNINRTVMCIDCPYLSKHLQGKDTFEQQEDINETLSGLCCGHCWTTLESVRTGNPLGCCHCYEVFEKVLIQELVKAEKLPQKLITAASNNSTSLHQGHVPGESKDLSPSLRLLALNEALNDTLTREDYEQAAWLRDQIKELTDHTHETDEGSQE